MATSSRFLILALLILPISACSLYRNKGRDQFEQRSSGQVRTDIGVSTALAADDNFSSCWIQNKDEALWSLPDETPLEIRALNDRQMTVCLKNNDEDQPDDYLQH